MVSAYINIFFIFVLMFIGYVLTYKQWFSNQIGDAFSKLVLQIALPCNMFLTITKNFSRSEFLHLVSGMIIPLISMLLTFVVSFAYCRIFRISQIPTHPHPLVRDQKHAGLLGNGHRLQLLLSRTKNCHRSKSSTS